MLSRWYDWIYKIVKWLRVPIHWVFGTHPELGTLVDSGRIRTGGRAIDLGCGTGREVIELARRGFDAFGVDISPTAISMARSSAHATGVDATFFVDDLTKPSRLKGKFDLIVDYGALNDLNPTQRDAYMRTVLPLGAAGSQFVLMCFDSKLPYREVVERFGTTYAVEHVSSKGETGGRRTISFYAMDRLTGVS